MKTSCTKLTVLVASALLLLACGTQRTGSANDTTGTNGATNGSGKVVKTDKIHNAN